MKVNRQKVFDKFGGHCAYCGCNITIKNFQVDHIVSRCQNQFKRIVVDIDHIDNLYPACRSCNIFKGAYSINGFRKKILEVAKIMRNNYANIRNLERFGVFKQVKTEVVFYFEDYLSGK